MGSKYEKDKVIGVILNNFVQTIAKLSGKVFRLLVLGTKICKIPGNSPQITHGAFFVLWLTHIYKQLVSTGEVTSESPYIKKGV